MDIKIQLYKKYNLYILLLYVEYIVDFYMQNIYEIYKRILYRRPYYCMYIASEHELFSRELFKLLAMLAE